MSSPESSPSLLQEPGQVVTALGLVAAGRITAFDWLADDAVHAPRTDVRVAFTRLAAGQVGRFDDLAAAARDVAGGGEEVLVEAAEPYLALFDGIGHRTRSQDWWERVVRTVVAGGMLRDLARVVAGQLPAPAHDVAYAALAGQGLTGLVAAEVARASGQDAALAARLALWGRRVAGEVLGAVQPVLAVAGSAGADLGELAAPALGAISAGHARRMDRLGLAA